MIAPVSIFKSVFCLFYHKPTLSVATTLYTLLCPVPYTSSPDVPLATPSNHWQMMCLYCTTLKGRTWPTARCQDKISSVCGHICENVNFLKFIKLICLEKYGDPPIKGTLWNNKKKKALYFWIGEGQLTEQHVILIHVASLLLGESSHYELLLWHYWSTIFTRPTSRCVCSHCILVFSHRYRYFASATWTYWNIK